MKHVKTEDKAKLEQFIVRSVSRNIKFPVQGAGPTSTVLTIQQIINDTSISTLDAYFKALKKLPSSSGSTRRGTQTNFYVSDVTVDELADIIDIIIDARERAADAHKKEHEITQLKNELSALETPEERRENIKKKLAQLETVG